MTVGKHRPRSSPRGDQSALCDICGSLWYRSRLLRKADGLLYCPDDIKGADSVTLAQANARDAATVKQHRLVRDSGSRDTSGAPTRELPDGIFGTNLSGWWGARETVLASGIRALPNVPAMFDVSDQGNMLQVEPARRPTWDSATEDITFDGTDDYLLTGYREYVGGGNHPSMFAIGSFATPLSATESTICTASDVGTTMTYTESTPNRIYISVTSGVLTASMPTVQNGAVGVSVPFTSTGLHVFQVRDTAQAAPSGSDATIELYIDGVLQATVPHVSGDGPPEIAPMYFAFMGAGVTGTTWGDPTTITSHNGRCNEMVLTYDAVTAAQMTSYLEYAGRNYAELDL